MNILITGSKGLIGYALEKRLAVFGIKVWGFDVKNHPYQTILDGKALEKSIEGCVGIVHLAGTSRVVTAERFPLTCLKNNIDGTQNVINAALKSPLKPWIIYASSREIYGQQKTLPVEEDATPTPMNVYAYSKVAAETKMREARERGLCTNVLRFSNVFGSPFDHADRVIPAFCRAALLERPLYVEGSKNMFDFTFVDDVVEGIHRMIHSLLESPQNFSSIHLTTGRGITLEEAAHIIKNQANSKSALVEKPSRSFDVAHFYGNPKRAKDLLGWQASFSFETAIETFLPLVQKQLEREGLFLNKVAS